MVASAQILYLSGNEVAAALELLRKVVDPESASRPHVTARYGTRALSRQAEALYKDVRVSNFAIVGAGTFDKPSSDAISTVFLACKSDELESVHYKPDYPDSVFHITVYEGSPSSFAVKVLQELKAFDWNIIVSIPSTATSYKISRGASVKRSGLSDHAIRLLADVTNRSVSQSDIGALPDAARLDIARTLCARIHRSVDVRSFSLIESSLRVFPTGPRFEQEPLWTVDEIARLVTEAEGEAATDKRRKSGYFITPPELAHDIVNAMLASRDLPTELRFCDPALGGGIFFAVFRRAVADRYAAAVGGESDPLRALRSAERWKHARLDVRAGDFLAQPKPEVLSNFVVANPPYVRHQAMDSLAARSRRETIGARVGLQIDGRADLSTYFVLAADAWLDEGGIAAWLLPSEFLVTDYGRTLRTYLLQDVRLTRVHVYEQKTSQFENARVTSAVIMFTKARPERGEWISFSRGGTLVEPLELTEVPRETLTPDNKWNWINLRPSAALPDRAMGVRIGELFAVQRGIATGANDTFVLSEEQLSEYAVEDRWVRPLLPRSRYLREDSEAGLIVDNVIEANPAGQPKVSRSLWLIDTTDAVDSIERESPTFGAYLRAALDRIADRTLVRERRTPLKQDRRVPPLVVFVYMAKHSRTGIEDRFYLNLSRAVVLNSYLGLTPRPPLESWMAEGGDIRELFRHIREIFPDELERRGRGYVDSLLKVEPRELAAIKLQSIPRTLRLMLDGK